MLSLMMYNFILLCLQSNHSRALVFMKRIVMIGVVWSVLGILSWILSTPPNRRYYIPFATGALPLFLFPIPQAVGGLFGIWAGQFRKRSQLLY